ncbi:MAG TPA: alpha/beta fold hydrolase [Mycobacteriales bacterium]|nr:alpha/beta fold hydrolase [Mycobacteriales bacterium]
MRINGVEHWVRRAGPTTGTPLVVLHGGPGGTIYDFEKVAGPLLEEHCPVVYYEQRGSGRSDPPSDGAYSIELLVSDLEQLRQQLGIQSMALLGISFGGQLACEYAVAHPERVRALILNGFGAPGPLAVSPQPAAFDAVTTDEILRARIRECDTADDIWAIVDQPTVNRFLFRRPESAVRVRELWTESGTVNTGAMAAALADQPPRERPLIDDLAELEIPILALIGLYDRNAGVDACRDLVTRVHDGHLVVFDGSAHFPHIEQTGDYIRAIAEFLPGQDR